MKSSFSTERTTPFQRIECGLATNDGHSLFTSFDLAVETENELKPSGTHNLSREGWDEDRERYSSLYIMLEN